MEGNPGILNVDLGRRCEEASLARHVPRFPVMGSASPFPGTITASGVR